MVAVYFQGFYEDDMIMAGKLDTFVRRTNRRMERSMKRNGLQIYYSYPEWYLQIAEAKVLSIYRPPDFREWILNEAPDMVLNQIEDMERGKTADDELDRMYGRFYGNIPHSVIRFRILDHPDDPKQQHISRYWTGPHVDDTVAGGDPKPKFPAPKPKHRTAKLDSFLENT